MKKVRLIPVGKIARTHGVRGAVKIYPYGESLGLQEPGDKLILQPAASARKQHDLTVSSLKPQGKFLLVQIEELTSIDEARAVVGEEVFLPEDRLPPTEEGEYYHYQLIGLRVETVEGKPVGILSSIIETGANDVYSVESEGREVLIPAVDEIITEVDLEGGRIVIDPPEGLIDDL
jgi:16S rRNA processing protein RimM